MGGAPGAEPPALPVQGLTLSHQPRPQAASCVRTGRLQPGPRTCALLCQDGKGVLSVLRPKGDAGRAGGTRWLLVLAGGPARWPCTSAGAAPGSGRSCPALCHLGLSEAQVALGAHGGGRGPGAGPGPAAPGPSGSAPRVGAPPAHPSEPGKGFSTFFFGSSLAPGTPFAPKLNLARSTRRQVHPSWGTGGPGGWPIVRPSHCPFVLGGRVTRFSPGACCPPGPLGWGGGPATSQAGPRGMCRFILPWRTGGPERSGPFFCSLYFILKLYLMLLYEGGGAGEN